MHAQVETAEIRSNRSIPDLLRSVTFELRDLVTDEVHLAKAEVTEKVAQAGNGIAAVMAGALIAFAGFLVILDAAVVALAGMLAIDLLWLSPLIVGGVVMIVGLILLNRAKARLKPRNLIPERSQASLKADKNLFKEKLS